MDSIFFYIMYVQYGCCCYSNVAQVSRCHLCVTQHEVMVSRWMHLVVGPRCRFVSNHFICCQVAKMVGLILVKESLMTHPVASYLGQSVEYSLTSYFQLN